MTDELGQKDIINCEKLKEITGETPMVFRGLYSEQKRNFWHCCTMKINTNSFLNFDALDTPTMCRLCLIPCQKQ